MRIGLSRSLYMLSPFFFFLFLYICSMTPYSFLFPFRVTRSSTHLVFQTTTCPFPRLFSRRSTRRVFVLGSFLKSRLYPQSRLVLLPFLLPPPSLRGWVCRLPNLLVFSENEISCYFCYPRPSDLLEITVTIK